MCCNHNIHFFLIFTFCTFFGFNCIFFSRLNKKGTANGVKSNWITTVLLLNFYSCCLFDKYVVIHFVDHFYWYLMIYLYLGHFCKSPFSCTVLYFHSCWSDLIAADLLPAFYCWFWTGQWLWISILSLISGFDQTQFSLFGLQMPVFWKRFIVVFCFDICFILINKEFNHFLNSFQCICCFVKKFKLIKTDFKLIALIFALCWNNEFNHVLNSICFNCSNAILSFGMFCIFFWYWLVIIRNFYLQYMFLLSSCESVFSPV